MIEIDIRGVLKATGGVLVSGKPETPIAGISTDSRKIRQGDLFIPLVGERFDGHSYIANSLEAGAVACLTQKDPEDFAEKAVIRVEDTGKALRDLAAWYRQKFTIPFAAITGSVGKTSTKDMVACVLGERYRVLKTEGNLNNEIGVPLTVFNLEEAHEAAVVEMGMSSFGEISNLTAIVKPNIAIITNVGMSHIEKLGSRQNILKAKMEILEGLNPKGLVVLNGDDNLLSGLKDLLPFRTVFYGLEEGLDYRATDVRTHGESGTGFEVMLDGREYEVHVPVPGVHHVHNALAAIAAGRELGMKMEEIIAGISRFSPGKMRQNILSARGLKVINDAYNASPQSMEAAIQLLADLGKEARKIAVLGDMLEMGDWAKNAHLDVGRFAVAKGVDLLAAVGPNGKYIVQGALESGMPEDRTAWFGSNGEALEYLNVRVAGGDMILVKGSRGMKMEEIVQGLTSES